MMNRVDGRVTSVVRWPRRECPRQPPTPSLSLDELAELGFAVVLYANTALRSAQRAVALAYAELRTSGIGADVVDALANFWEGRQEAAGKPYYDELEARYAT